MMSGGGVCNYDYDLMLEGCRMYYILVLVICLLTCAFNSWRSIFLFNMLKFFLFMTCDQSPSCWFFGFVSMYYMPRDVAVLWLVDGLGQNLWRDSE